MRNRGTLLLGAFVLLVAATAAAQPGQDKGQEHGRPPGVGSGAPPGNSAVTPPQGSASAPGQVKDGGPAVGVGESPLGIKESDNQRQRRLDHRKMHHEKLDALLKGRPPTAITQEQRELIKHHNRIVARLEWIQAWAENEKKTAVAERAKAALAKEDARFEAKLQKLAAGAPAGSASGKPAASASGGAR